MATETLLVSAAPYDVGFDDLWSGASKVAALAADDHLTSDTYINSGTSLDQGQSVKFAASTTIQDGATISNVQLVGVCQRGGGSNANFTLSTIEFVTGDSQIEQAQTGTSHTSTASYTTFTDDFALNIDGGAWTKSQIDTLGAYIINSQARDVKCTYLAAIVTFTNPPAALTAGVASMASRTQTSVTIQWTDATGGA